MRILAVLTVRNEGAYLIDWLAHHRAAGVTDVLAFSNDCTDGTDAMLDRLAALGWLTHVRNDGPHPEGPQWAALKAADRHPLRAQADWICVIDIDEYINVRAPGHRLPDLIAALPAGTTALAMTWRMFGSAGLAAFDDRPVTQQFTRAAPDVLHWPWRAVQFKALFRNDGSYRRLGVHRPRAPDPAREGAILWADGDGRPLPPGFRRGRVFCGLGRQAYGLVQLNHYALGSAEAFVVKCDRGRANREGAAFDAGYWVERNFDAVEDRSILALEPAAAVHRAGLRADPVLGPLHEAAVAWRRARFAALMAEEPWRAFYGRLLLAGPTRLLSPDAARMIWHWGQPGNDDGRL